MTPTREILQDRTVEELKELAREKGLSGYSNLRKSELIDMIMDNLSKEDIASYFGLEEETPAPFTDKLSSRPWLVAGVTVCLLAIVAGISARQIFGPPEVEESQDYTTYMENVYYKFSFSAPSS